MCKQCLFAFRNRSSYFLGSSMNVNVNNKSFLPANLTAQDPTNASDEIVRRMHRQWCVCTDEGESVSVMGRRGDGGGTGGGAVGGHTLILSNSNWKRLALVGRTKTAGNSLVLGSTCVRSGRRVSQDTPLAPPPPKPQSPTHIPAPPQHAEGSGGTLC